jgi:hypothetical protein
LTTLIGRPESQPWANPPAFVARVEYKGDTVYFLPGVAAANQLLSFGYPSAGVSGALRVTAADTTMVCEPSVAYGAHVDRAGWQPSA